MGNVAAKYLCFQCIQYPGCLCCCPDTCRYTRCGTKITKCANFWPCLMCLRSPIEKKILFLGQTGAGKTSLLYYLMFGSVFRQAEPTLGMCSVCLLYFFYSISESIAVPLVLSSSYTDTCRCQSIIRFALGFGWEVVPSGVPWSTIGIDS